MTSVTTGDLPGRFCLTGGRLIDGLGNPPIGDGFVLVEDGRIAGLGPMGEAPGAHDAPRLDLAGRTLMPGLIDCHAHLVYSGFRSLDALDRLSLEASTVNAVNNAAKVIAAGYTSVRDVGTVGNVAATVRDAVNEGRVRGPRVIASGPIIGPTSGMVDTLPAGWQSSRGLGVLCDGVDAIVKEVRRQIKNGVDNIKLGASGVEVGPYAYTWMTTLSEAEIRAGTEEAHRWGRSVAIHCQSYDAVKFALRAGVDTIEHATRLDNEALELFANSRTALVPTLSTLFSVLEFGEKLNLMAKQREEMAINKELWVTSFQRALAAGIPIGAGADLGNRYLHGENARELVHLINCGMSPMAAIQSATGTAARILGRADSVGALAPGRLGDILVVDGDPLQDIQCLLAPDKIWLVLLEGRPAAGQALKTSNRPPPPAPEPLVAWTPREGTR
ncbi:MAG: amidohydrolase family protein [Alphaproteobacteria bacterium]|nr:amidohydrolase family protein [Alphaproteobacteria bacterium]